MTSNLTPLQQLMFSLIEIWHTSGQSQKSFCHEKDLAYSKFHYWRKKYQEYRSLSSGEPFVAVTVKKASTWETSPPLGAGLLELVFPDGRRLVFNQTVEAEFLKALLT